MKPIDFILLCVMFILMFSASEADQCRITSVRLSVIVANLSREDHRIQNMLHLAGSLYKALSKTSQTITLYCVPYGKANFLKMASINDTKVEQAIASSMDFGPYPNETAMLPFLKRLENDNDASVDIVIASGVYVSFDEIEFVNHSTRKIYLFCFHTGKAVADSCAAKYATVLTGAKPMTHVVRYGQSKGEDFYDQLANNWMNRTVCNNCPKTVYGECDTNECDR